MCWCRARKVISLWLLYSGFAWNWCQNLQDFNRGPISGVNDAKAAECCRFRFDAKPFGHLTAECDAYVGDWLNSAEHIVLDQHTAKRSLPFQNLIANWLRANTEINPNETKLNDLSRLLCDEQNLSRVLVPAASSGKNSYIDSRMEKLFDRHGHVIGVGEESMVRLRQFVRRNFDRVGPIVRSGEQCEKLIQSRGAGQHSQPFAEASR